MARFKIDLNPHSVARPFGLFIWRDGRWFGGAWVEVDAFNTREEAKLHHEKIKDLPEYL